MGLLRSNQIEQTGMIGIKTFLLFLVCFMSQEALLERLREAGVSTNDTGDVQSLTIEDAVLREKRQALKILALRKARKGDVFNLLRLEWPELIITDKQELADFKEHCNRKEHLDLRLDDFQVDEIRASFDKMHSQVLVSGGTKLGKGFTLGGVVVNLWFNLYTDSKIVLIGPDVEHVKRCLFAEALIWRKKMTSHKDGSVPAECLTEKICDPNNPDHFIIIANPKTGEGLSGIHSGNPLFCFDESSGQPDSRYTDSLSQCASGLLVAIGNPRQPSGWFWRAFKGFEHGCKTVNSDAGPRRLISIGLIDCINVRANRVAGIVSPPGGMTVLDVFIPAGEVIPPELREKTKLLIPGQGCKKVCETLKRTVTADEVEWRVYGRFPKDNKVFILFQQSWWERSIERHKEIKDKIRPLALGIDVAGSENGDYCALAWGDTHGCLDIDLIQNPNLMMLKGDVYQLAASRGVELRGGYVPVAIDSMAMGQMFADAMELDGCFVIRVGGSSGAERNKEQYVNRRAEMYGDLAGALNQQTFQKQIWALPDIGELWEELHALEKIYDLRGKWKLNSKRPMDAAAKARNQDGRDSVFEKINRSSDRSDSVAYLFAAVMNLADYYDETTTQFDPSSQLKSYRDNGYGIISCEFFLGKEIDMLKEDFVAKFGSENPKIMGQSA